MGMRLSSFLQSQPNVFIYQTLGWKFTFYYTTLLGILYFFFKRIERQEIKKSIHDTFGSLISDSEKKSITWDVFRGIILHYYEKLFNAFSSAETLRAFFQTQMKGESIDEIKEGLSKGNGVLLVTGHFGGVLNSLIVNTYNNISFFQAALVSRPTILNGLHQYTIPALKF